MVVGLRGDCDVYKPNGELLCALRRGALDEGVCEQAFPQLHYLRKYITDNRGAYTGHERVGGEAEKRIVRQDGRPSRQNRTMDDSGNVVYVASAVVGYYDRQGGRFPFCRQTAFTKNEVGRWRDVVPLVEHVSATYERVFPGQNLTQRKFVKSIAEDFKIPNTVFTTLTVNNNVCGTVHRDKGDYKGGLGMISYHCRGSYAGGELVFPQYKVFAECGDRDLLFFNPHEWHGVNPMRQTTPEQDGVRISVVYYVREKMAECGSALEEAARAKEKYGALDGGA